MRQRPARLYPARRSRRRRKQQIQHAFFGCLLRAVGNFVELLFTNHVDGGFHQVAHHGLDIAAHVTDFRVLGSFHFDEGATGQARQAACDFRFAYAGGSDHQNIFRQNIFRDFRRKFLPAHAIAKSDGNGAFCGVLAHDVLVEFDDNFPRGHVIEGGEQLLFLGGRGAIGAGGEYDFFLGF